MEPNIPCSGEASLEWGASADKDQDYAYRLDFVVRLGEVRPESKDATARTMLHHLGYWGKLADMVRAFQHDYEVPLKPWFDEATNDKLRSVYQDGLEAERTDTDEGYEPFDEPNESPSLVG